MVGAPRPLEGGPTDPWPSGCVKVSGGHLAYHRTGSPGPALVLSHGLTDNGLCWLRLARALAGDFDIIMLDARGHGLSSPMPAEGRSDPAKDIAQAIDGLGLERPIVMGHSVGARATLDYAAANPGQVSKIILEDPPFLPVMDAAQVERRKAAFRAHVQSLRALSEAKIDAQGRAASPLWHADDFPAWAQAKTQVDEAAYPTYGTAWRDSLSRLSVPTLLVHGEAAQGGLITRELAEEIRSINSHIETAQIAGAGHNVRRENFALFLSTVRAFLVTPPLSA